MTNPSDTEAGFLVRLIVLEKQIEKLENTQNKATDTINDLIEKLNNLKYSCQSNTPSKNFVANIEKNIKDLEDKVAAIRTDVSEFSIFKKLGWLVVSFIVISVLGFVLNTSIFNKTLNGNSVSPDDISKKLDDISEKLSNEYKK